MSLYRYEAMDKAGKLVMGTMDAANEAAVDARLSQMGYRTERVMPAQSSARVISAKTGVHPPRSTQLNKTVQFPESKLASVKAKDSALFFRQFAAMVRSGISIYQALENLAPRTIQPALNATAREMAETARSGGRISDVMAKHPRVFAEHVVGAVRAGEKGGFLEIVLDEIALEYELEVAFYKGTWLPKVLIVQAILAVAIIQPFFIKLLAADKQGTEYDFWVQMREYAALVFFRNLPIAGLIIFLLWYGYQWLQRPEQLLRRDTLALKVPVFGDLSRQRSLASFVRMLRRLFHAGVGPINAWEGAMNVVPNAVIREKLATSYGMMQGNVPLHEAFTATGLFANETEQLLATGMVSGQMIDMLDRVAEYYQDNVDRARTKSRFWMFRLAIITVMILMGTALILMASSYFKAIFDNPFTRPEP
jgi:type IV pilus assembly protein PilC